MTMSYPNKKKQFFVAFPWVVTSTGPGGLCVFLMTGAPEGSTESGSGEARNQT